MGASYHELAGRVDIILYVVVEQREYFLAELCLHARYENVEYVLANLAEHLLVGLELRLLRVVGGFHEVVVLGRHHDGVDALWHAVVAIFYRDLALGVGAEVCHLLALLANVGKRAHYEVCEVERGRHVVLGLVYGIAEHHALVARALLIFLLARHATVYVVALLVYGGENAARIAVELIFRLGVANLVDGLARNCLQVDIFF